MKHCAYCTKHFAPRVHNQAFCSRVCRDRSLSGKPPEYFAQRLKCAICEKPMTPITATHKLCSVACKDAWRRLREHDNRAQSTTVRYRSFAVAALRRVLDAACKVDDADPSAAKHIRDVLRAEIFAILSASELTRRS
jgi:hypothetical protein